jgi:hypothetical protein
LLIFLFFSHLFFLSFLNFILYSQLLILSFILFPFLYFSESYAMADAWIVALNMGLTEPHAKLLPPPSPRKSIILEHSKPALGKVDVSSWSSAQTCIFLDLILAQQMLEDSLALSADSVHAMDNIFGFSKSHNAEITYRWLMLGMRSEADWLVAPAVDFVTKQGRMKVRLKMLR